MLGIRLIILILILITLLLIIEIILILLIFAWIDPRFLFVVLLNLFFNLIPLL